MTIEDRRKCFVERKELENHPCSTSHFVNLGVVSSFYWHLLEQRVPVYFAALPLESFFCLREYDRELCVYVSVQSFTVGLLRDTEP